jgi:hypothetical protein
MTKFKHACNLLAITSMAALIGFTYMQIILAYNLKVTQQQELLTGSSFLPKI